MGEAMIAGLPAVLAAVTALAAAAPAPASPGSPGEVRSARTLGVLILMTPEVGLEISEVYAAAREAIEAETALDVAPPEVFAALPQSAYRECAGDGRCFARRVSEAGTDLDLLLLL